MQSPVANRGRNFSFCASVPYQTMGKVPMPTWALESHREAAQLGEMVGHDRRRDLIHGQAAVFLRDVDGHQAEISSFLEQGAGDVEVLRLDLLPPPGRTSLRTNSEAVRAIWRCSSVKVFRGHDVVGQALSR